MTAAPGSFIRSRLESRAGTAIWHAIKRLDKGKVNSPWIALRNSLAVALPLGIGIAVGNPLGAVAVTTGALNACYSDGTDPYRQRARRMLTWSVLGAVAVFAGSATGRFHVAAVLIAMTWAFVAGMLIAVSTRAGDLGLNTFVAVIVFAARGPATIRGCLNASLLVLAGGLLQTLFALLLWPVRGSAPERRAIASVYEDLANSIRSPSEALLQAPLTLPSPQIQDTLSALGKDHSTEGERFRLLFDQVDRIRLSAFQLERLRSQLAHEREKERTPSPLLEGVADVFRSGSQLLHNAADSLLTDTNSEKLEQFSQESEAMATRLQALVDPHDPLEQDVVNAVDVLFGQIRAVARLTVSATPVGEEILAARESEKPVHLRITDWADVLRANLNLHSATFRHALRLAVCVGIGDTAGHMAGWDRSYWLPMTVAVILKPDFTTTLSRGVLRLCGTLAGLMLATVLYHALPGTALTQLLLVGVFTFVLRMYGPANYGVFSVAVSGLIVFLIAETGVPPAQVVVLRGLNTAAGGILALLAYAAWPTWERRRVSDTMAEMIDAARLYFQAVMAEASQSDEQREQRAECARQDWRRARSNAEASVDRVSSEPVSSSEKISELQSMLASSHSLVHAFAGLEAGFLQSPLKVMPEALQTFSHDVEFTLYYLSAALRGSVAATQTLPKLREDHRRLLEKRQSLAEADEFVLIETDRITVNLNTLREQVMRYIA